MIEDMEPIEEPKDRALWWWLGVLALTALLILALWVASRNRRDVTEVRAKHILVQCKKDDPVDRARALELVKTLRGRLEKGERFSRLAKEYSDDPASAARGGDLGYYPRGKFEAAFEEYVWNAPAGQVSGIIQTSYGFHLIVVTDRHISEADQYEMELERKAKAAQESSGPAPPAATP